MSTTTETPFDPAQAESEVLETCAGLTQAAQTAGADDAEAFAVREHSVTVRYEKGDLKIAQIDEGTSLGLRVMRGQQQGFASTNQVDDEALQHVARDACTLAALAPPDEANGLPDARPIPSAPGLVVPELAELPIEAVVDHASDLVARVVAVDSRISLDQSSARLSRVTLGIHSSRGVHAAESDAQLALSVFGMAIDGDDVGGFDIGFDTLRDPAALEGAVDKLVKQFTSATLANLGAGAATTYRGKVLFAPSAFKDVFIAPICSAASAIAVQRGRSALADRIGQKIADPRLSIIDDPSDRTLAGAASFDREGAPVTRFPLVEAGELKSYMYDSYAARVAGRESTGHALGGARAVPGLGPHALRVEVNGGIPTAELTEALDRGLVVQRFSGTVDPASGDFSGVAKSARWVEGGQVVRSVKEALIAGNVFTALQTVAHFSDESERLMGSAYVPWALVDGISVTAG